MTSIAVIGSGLSGLTLAHKLRSQFEVQIFEKAPKPGGRITSRLSPHFTFDHGAQFFSVKTPTFAEFIHPMLESGVIADWQARFVEIDVDEITSHREWTGEFPHYVGTPSMAAISEWLSNGLNIHYDAKVTQLIQKDKQWIVETEDGLRSQPFDWLITTPPVEQASALLPDHIVYKTSLAAIKMLPCYALMVALKESPNLAFDAALVKDQNLSWISVNHTKPGRKGFGLVSHAANTWAAENIDIPLPEVKKKMLATLLKITNISPEIIVETDIKRWVYANIAKQDGPPYFIDHANRIASCGDWCIAGRVEAAFTSGSLLANTIIEMNSP
ncbi:NAD(P)/FAD-dependent oxidoreductase [Methylophaga sp. OBS3]|uniref:NAD(P)/FAD-dependent oxidoreductase n=1 Tax=Methylophaga sp. OBS3 TaxID=2991934 RepID=UPI0022519114|nr:NAD(P)-binding protein [Methylophaga sp. OBS3]MCX4190834.1 NAD(P)-binding protein [Methylophaga sp. OBS3]